MRVLQNLGRKEEFPLQVEKHTIFNGNKELHHGEPNLANVERVTWTFEDQKNDEKMVTIPHKNSTDPIMNPVYTLAATVQRIHNYPGTNNETSICTYLQNKKLQELSCEEILDTFRSNTETMVKTRLGLTRNNISTHSTRLAAVMAMLMDDTLIYMIMLMGRWSSDAFLKYILRQVIEFSKGMSPCMIRNTILFSISKQHCSTTYPLTQNPNFFVTNLTMAPFSHHQSSWPTFSRWHRLPGVVRNGNVYGMYGNLYGTYMEGICGTYMERMKCKMHMERMTWKRIWNVWKSIWNVYGTYIWNVYMELI